MTPQPPILPHQPHQFHQFHRHPALPWAELRVSQQSPHCYRLHMHAEYSIGIVDAGHTVLQHAQGASTLQTGDVVLIEPGVWHACNPAQQERWSYRMLYVQADWLHAQLGACRLQFLQRALRDTASRAAVNQLCHCLLAGDASGWTAQLLALLRQLHIVQPVAQSPLAGASAGVGTGAIAGDDTAVRHALQLLHQQPDAAPSVQQLAHAGGLSASCFIRRFKAATGVTPGAYRLNLRLNGARHLLAQGVALAEAAHSMGFADQAHLQRTFKAHHALTPGRYAHSAPSS